MPTQEELNAAQVELDIANDNYAAMANRYNKFQDLFKAYAKASPEMQDRAAESMGYALEEFYKLQQDMYAAEDRIQQAQNKWNDYNEVIAQQPVQQTVARSNYNSGRYISPTPTIEPEPMPLNNNPLEDGINSNETRPAFGMNTGMFLRKAAEPVPTPNNGYYKSNTLRGILGNAGHNLNNFWQMTKGSFRNMNDALSKASDATGKFLIGTPQRQL